MKIPNIHIHLYRAKEEQTLRQGLKPQALGDHWYKEHYPSSQDNSLGDWIHFLSENPKQGRPLSAMGSGTANQSLAFTNGNSNAYNLIYLGETVSTSSAKVALLCRKQKIFGEGKSKSVRKKENKLHGKRQITLGAKPWLCSLLSIFASDLRGQNQSAQYLSLLPFFSPSSLNSLQLEREAAKFPPKQEKPVPCFWKATIFRQIRNLNLSLLCLSWALLPLFHFCKAKKKMHSSRITSAISVKKAAVIPHFIPISRPSSLRNLKKGMPSFRISI